MGRAREAIISRSKTYKPRQSVEIMRSAFHGCCEVTTPYADKPGNTHWKGYAGGRGDGESKIRARRVLIKGRVVEHREFLANTKRWGWRAGENLLFETSASCQLGGRDSPPLLLSALGACVPFHAPVARLLPEQLAS